MLEAVLERITYANEDTGYTIARVATERTGPDLLTVVGPLLGAQVGESLRLTGRWGSHPKYGKQFQVDSYTTVLPATIQGIRRYLGSGMIKGIGPVMAVVIEKPRWNLTIFKVHFGLLTLKAYTKGERVLRFEAIAHHTKQLGCGRTLDKFPQITTRLTAMVDRFTSMLDCVDVGFLPDGILDQLPAPSKLAGTRIGGIDMNIPRVRAALAAALALAVAPAGFTVAQFTAQVRAMTGQAPEDYSVRQGAYDLRKLRGKRLVLKPGRTRRYQVPGVAARTIAALLTVRDKVIAPLIAGIRTPRRGRPPKNWTNIDRDYETLRRDMQTLFNDLAISTKATTLSTTSCR